MNRDKRHQLERNELAERLAPGLESVKSILPVIIGAIAVVVIGSLVWGLYSTSAKKKESAAWTEYYFNLAGGDAETFLDVAEGFPDSAMSGWARLSAGDSYLNAGIEALYTNRADGEDQLKMAIDTYQEALDSADTDELSAKAALGLARAHESLGDLDKASGFYEQFKTLSTQPALTNAVNQNLAFLTSPEGKEFYSWFSKLDPKPDAPISLPSNLSTPPTSPDIEFGSPGSDASAASGNLTDALGEIDASSMPPLDLGSDAPEGGEDKAATDTGTGSLELAPPATGPPANPPPATDPPESDPSETKASSGNGQ